MADITVNLSLSNLMINAYTYYNLSYSYSLLKGPDYQEYEFNKASSYLSPDNFLYVNTTS